MSHQIQLFSDGPAEMERGLDGVLSTNYISIYSPIYSICTRIPWLAKDQQYHYLDLFRRSRGEVVYTVS